MTLYSLNLLYLCKSQRLAITDGGMDYAVPIRRHCITELPKEEDLLLSAYIVSV
jgi:hypothetical protein